MFKVVGLSGKAGAGKSTVARILADEYGFEILPFAGPLKRMSIAFGLTREQVYGDEKERQFDRPLPPMTRQRALDMVRVLPFVCWHYESEPLGRHTITAKTFTEAIDTILEWDIAHRKSFLTPRRFMQLLGTEWGRDMIGERFWVDVWLHEADMILDDGVHIVADDVRFSNEARAIQDGGGAVIEVLGRGAALAGVDDHRSEMVGFEANATLNNRGGLADIRKAVREMMSNAGVGAR